ncbi:MULTISPECIES: DUF2501 domain-containing protein [Enterobacteriaceae]|uniref:DUF2501 domain-containing protein n=1 Tax=Kluyvera genomosp. 2 TaxID=2774054 RepID=A0A2T2Y486_9ENTR|nr:MULTISPECIES: DUF2501 domain-containing protein [Enterobacteriaceae]HAT3917986.1 DUF2501 domain-containing protein [Kluyvera ascorbata]PSR47327.1 hypothetical protein C8256_06640 [Kluyvera genomosp. 2]BBQ85641.1 hypothetical protein WP3W18E02_41700 [Klebsiella sp. WP3-W18-ESBL-02]BBR22637.1 hypothetical protein WP3S18E05_41170 [Klebsiella sp. WP3-S18-ESBL-05]BBR60712.1 hypothetical protein WP4W18E05_40800 [Klebsiella sp. WP4-W18-ESBL-05]
MKSVKSMLCRVIIASAFVSTAAGAVSLNDLSSAASQLAGSSSTSQSGGSSLSSLTSLLNGGSQSLSASSMNNAAGIMGYCAKEKLASVANVDNVKNQVLDKLGLNTATEQKQDTGYMEGIQGLLNAKDGQKLDLDSLGNTELGKKVKAKACDFVLKQGVNFIS